MKLPGLPSRYLVDTSLRDGEQSPGLALSVPDKVRIARILDRLGIYEIEGGIPAMGDMEQQALRGMKQVCRHARIAAWNRMSFHDLRLSMACAPDILHISVPVSPLQIHDKLHQTENWVTQHMRQVVLFARQEKYEVTVGFEDASRAKTAFMLQLAHILHELGVSRIRLADTVGVLLPSETYALVRELSVESGMPIEFHAHNDFGMAAANSIAAAQAGAAYIDTTAGGIGERAGNCAMGQLLEAGAALYDFGVVVSLALDAEKVVQEILLHHSLPASDCSSLSGSQS